MKIDDSKDIKAVKFYDKIYTFQDIYQKDSVNTENPLDLLNFILSNNLSFPKFSIALRILLTLPVSVATGKRSFSKLKLMNTYLRTSMSQDRVSLSLIAIENEICAELNIDTIISNFVNIKSRSIKL